MAWPIRIDRQADVSGATRLGLAWPPEPRINERKLHDGQRVVIGRDPVVPLESTAEAAMDNHLLSRWADEEGGRCHERTAVARPVARRLAIDMA